MRRPPAKAKRGLTPSAILTIKVALQYSINNERDVRCCIAALAELRIMEAFQDE